MKLLKKEGEKKNKRTRTPDYRWFYTETKTEVSVCPSVCVMF